MATERYEIVDRVVLITGPARGIGAEAARQLAARGARLSLVGLEPEELEQRAAELAGETAWFEADVTDRGALDAAVEGTVERFGGIDVVIANAGIAPFGTVATIDPADFERTIEVNLLGVWRTVRSALPHVMARRGYVLPVASAAAAFHAPLLAHYSASKAGVEAFSDALRSELAHTGTKVGVAYFGFIETDMVRSISEQPAVERLRQEMKGPVGRVLPVSAAGGAIVRGIERRARRVYAPRWVLPFLYARDFLGPLGERVQRKGTEDAVRLAEGEASAVARVATAASSDGARDC